MAMPNEALSALIDYYHSLLNKPVFLMTEEQQEAHCELLHKLSMDIMKMRTEGFSTLNELIKHQKENFRQATENLSSAANDSTYSSLVEGVSKSIDMLDGLIMFAQ